MPASDLHLAVEIAAWWTTAVYQSAGTVQPVLFDGQPRLPSGVHADPRTGALLTGPAALAAGLAAPHHYQPDPLARLYTGAPDGDGPDPVAAVAAVLAHVANVTAGHAGTPIAALTLVTPHTWGFRARERLQQAATSAGLPAPNIVTAAAAAAAFAAPADAGTGRRFVLVAAADLDLTILDPDHGHQQLASTAVRDPGSPAVDDALIQAAAGTSVPGDWRLAREVRQARTMLTLQPQAPLLLPDSRPAAISRDDLITAARPHLEHLDDSLKQLLADADLASEHISAVILAGDDPLLPPLGAALTAAGLPAPVTAGDTHAIAHGALRLARPLTGGGGPAGTAATVRLPRTRLTLANLTRISVLTACSVALLLQTITTADTWQIGGRLTDVRLSVENLGVAAALAALTAWAAAQLAPTTWLLTAPADDNTTTGVLLRRGYFSAAVLGLALAGLWGLGTGTGVGFASDTYLEAALTAAAPIAACAALIALTASRIPAPALLGWLRRASPPVAAIVLAAAGIYLQRAANTLSFPVDLLGQAGFIHAVGAASLGVATALTATRQPLLRTAAAVILGAGYALVSNVATVGYLTIAYTVVLVWWALATAAATLRTATPHTAASLRRWLNAPPASAVQRDDHRNGAGP